MTQTLTITLDDELVAFIDRRIADGRSASAGEVVERVCACSRSAKPHVTAAGSLIEGEASDGFEDFDADGFLTLIRQTALS